MRTKLRLVGIQRAERFSPNSVDRDLAILDAVVSGFDGKIIPEDNISANKPLIYNADIVLSMARSNEALSILDEAEKGNALVINPASGVRFCQRSRICQLMSEHHIPQPPTDNTDNPVAGYWIKRGDMAAQSHDDVVFCKDKAELERVKESFLHRGIHDYIVQTHVAGDLVKFYGVEGTGFFATFYPADDGYTKFGDEVLNGQAHHYAYDRELLSATASRLSQLAHTPVYGGDAIVCSDGSFVIIDFNDWPSFSRCREEAATAIKRLVVGKCK